MRMTIILLLCVGGSRLEQEKNQSDSNVLKGTSSIQGSNKLQKVRHIQPLIPITDTWWSYSYSPENMVLGVNDTVRDPSAILLYQSNAISRKSCPKQQQSTFHGS